MSLLEVSRSGAVLVVVVARAERRNVLDLPLATELAELLEDVGADIRAVALLAAGPHCVGGDVRAFAADANPGDYAGELARVFHRSVRAMRTGVPVVIGVRGWAAGGGMSLMLNGDVVVAGESAMFRPAYPGIGVTPDGGMSWILPRLVGERRARALLVRDEALTASDALRLGIVDEVVLDAEVDERALAVAGELAAGPTAALVAAKRLVTDGWGRPLDEQLDAEAESIGTFANGPTGREGIAAFAGRRPPVYQPVSKR